MTPSGVGNTVVHQDLWGDEYVIVNTVNGGNYLIESCSDLTGIDTHITLFRQSNGAVLGFNDNTAGCGNGTKSRVNYTATFAGAMLVMMDHMPGCTGQGTSLRMTVTLTGVVDVEWLGFTGEQHDEGVRLAWQTANEYRSGHFIVERSDDAVHFEPIGRVNAAGASSEQQTYQFDDSSPLTGRNYYRVKEVNLEGQTDTHADMVSVVIDGAPRLSLLGCAPNPASSAVSIRLQSPSDAACVASLLDLSGRRLREWELPAASGLRAHTLPIEDMASGTYLLQVRQGAATAHRKLVIQH